MKGKINLPTSDPSTPLNLILFPEDFLNSFIANQNRILEMLELKTETSLNGFISEKQAMMLLNKKSTWFWIQRKTGEIQTRILLFIAYAIIYECPDVFGYKINSFGNVLFVNLEISEKDFKAFTDPIINFYEKQLGLFKKHSLFITSFRDCGNKLNDIKLVVQKYSPEMVIIDSYKIYQSLVCGEENQREINNSNFEKVLRLLDELVCELDTTIVLINHTNKDTRGKESNADLMFGPGALPDFVDQVTLIRKTKFPNQRLIVPDKSRYCAEGFVTTNLIEIVSTDPSSPYPDQLYFKLISKNVEESDFLPSSSSRRIDSATKKEIIEFVLSELGTMEDAAEKFLGNRSLKGTVSKIISKYKSEQVF